MVYDIDHFEWTMIAFETRGMIIAHRTSSSINECWFVPRSPTNECRFVLESHLDDLLVVTLQQVADRLNHAILLVVSDLCHEAKVEDREAACKETERASLGLRVHEAARKETEKMYLNERFRHVQRLGSSTPSRVLAREYQMRLVAWRRENRSHARKTCSQVLASCHRWHVRKICRSRM